MQRREQDRSTREVAFALCDTRLRFKCVHVVRCNIENLIKLSHCFGETTKVHIGIRVLGKDFHVARVEPLGFVKVMFALLPLAASAFELGQRLRNPAAIRQERTGLLKVTRSGVVVLQAGVVVIALGMHGLAKIGLKTERRFGGLPCLFAEGRLLAEDLV